MKKLFAGVALSASLALFATSALADGMARRGGGATGVYNWSGIYVGSHVGYAWADADLSEQSDSTLARRGLANVGTDGWLIGSHLGVNMQNGPWVFGTELSFSGGEVDGSTTCAADLGALSGATCKASIDWMIMALGRLGYARDDWMLYATGGLVLAGVTAEWAHPTVNPGFARGSVTHDGFAFGGGIERAYGNMILGVEYMHVWFDDTKTHFVDDIRESLNAKLDADIVRLRLSWKFGCCEAAAPAPLK